MNNLAYETDESIDLATYVSHRKQDLRGYIEIDHGIYIERNTSIWTKLSILRRLFALYHLDPANLVFYLRDGDDPDEDTEITGTRHEIRRKFWTYALETIKEANAESGAFSCFGIVETIRNLLRSTTRLMVLVSAGKRIGR